MKLSAMIKAGVAGVLAAGAAGYYIYANRDSIFKGSADTTTPKTDAELDAVQRGGGAESLHDSVNVEHRGRIVADFFRDRHRGRASPLETITAAQAVLRKGAPPGFAGAAPLGLLLGKMDFSSMFINLSGQSYPTIAAAKAAGAATLNYGMFIGTIFDFLIVAFAIFLLIRQVNKMKRQPAAAASTTKDCPFCASAIPIPAKRCPHCTSQLTA